MPPRLPRSASFARGGRRSLATLLALASLCALTARAAAAAPTDARPVAPCDLLAPAPLAFRFGTGSRPAAPAVVADDGSVYIGTSEGYLHALDRRGGYLWGYTLRGPVTGRPTLGASGAVLVPTARRVYAIRPDGSLLWAFDSPIPVLGDLVRDGIGRFFFASDDGRLLALSGRGGLVSFVPGRGPFAVLTTSLPGGALAAAHVDGSVVLTRAAKNQKFELGRAPTSLLSCAGAELCAIVDGSLMALGGGSEAVKLEAQRAASNGDFLAVLASERRLAFYDGPRRELRFVLELPEAASAEPVVDTRGQVYVPLTGGGLLAVTADGRPRSCTQVAHSPLGVPVLDEAHGRILVAAREGVLGAIEVE